MDLSTNILGASVVTALATRARAPILTIGRDTFQRAHLARVGCFNFIAAQHLSSACTALGVTSTRDLFDRIPPAALVLPGVGSIALAVLGAAFEAKGVGGAHPLEAWVSKHRPAGTTRDFVTFSTMKANEHKRERDLAQQARKRRSKGRRRGGAHLPSTPPAAGVHVSH